MLKSLVLAGALALAAVMAGPGSASAAPVAPQAALVDSVATPAPIQTVQYGYYRRGYYGRPRGYGRRFYGGPRYYRRRGYYGRPVYGPRPGFYGPRRGFYGY